MRLHQVTVDDREQLPKPSVTVAALKKLDVPAVVGRLPYGDFHWVVEPEDPTGQWWSIVVERKSLRDLVASVQDGRLAGYIDATGGNSPPPTQIRALLLEGDMENGVPGYRGRDWSVEQLSALLFDVQLLGVVTLTSPSASQTPNRIAAFWKWSGKDAHTALLRPALPGISDDYLDPETKAQVRILMCLPGWGEGRARAAIKHFGSAGLVLKHIMEGEVKTVTQVPGVGKGVVEAARKFLA